MSYRAVRTEPLPALGGSYLELVHEQTGARHVHVACPDGNNGFAVTFPTVPKDSTGVAHILEHCALAGSRRFPVRDPFFSMLPRSLNTFMNAMTSSDWTTYPFSTRNAKDWFNLLDVYLDAVFFPLLDDLAFRQEGHRLEHVEPRDRSSGLAFKGVVFNEMKGAISTPHDVMDLAIGEALMPDLTYAHNSGGDPERILDLTPDDMRAFHATHYHPSNAYFVTYGNLALDRVLAAIEPVLSSFERIAPDTEIGEQRRFDEPVEAHRTYPIAPTEDPKGRSQVLLSWLTAPVADAETTLGLQALTTVLLDNAASPLQLALVSSGLGDALADGSGLNTFYKEAVFGAGLQGTEPEHADAIEHVVLDTLGRLADDGVEREVARAAIHQLELEAREISNAGAPYFIKVLYRVVGPLVYGGDAYRVLRIDDDLERLRAGAERGDVFEGLIRTHLLDNPHRARILLLPDASLEARRGARERDRVERIAEQLSDDDHAALVEQSRALEARQDPDEDLSCLPTLGLDDITRDLEAVAYERAGTIALVAQPTNGLVYLDLAADAAGVPDELVERLPLLAFGLSRTGAAGLDYVAMARRIAEHTGGVDAWTQARTSAAGAPRRSVLVRGRALVRNAGALAGIAGDLLRDVQFEPDRLREIAGERRAALEGALEHHATQLAFLLAAAQLVPAGVEQHRLGGAGQLALARALADADERELQTTVEELHALRDALFRTDAISACLTAPEDALGSIGALAAGVLGSLPPHRSPGAIAAAQAAARNEARTASFPGAYNAKVLRTIRFGHPDSPVLTAIAELVRATFLHREVREAGGAYGASARYDADAGLFALLSFRDPHLDRTFEAFERAVAELCSRTAEAEDVKEAILAASATLDPLQSPDTRGPSRFFDDLAGYTLDTRAAHRRALLDVTPDDIVRVASAHLAGAPAALATVANASLTAGSSIDFNVEPL